MKIHPAADEFPMMSGIEWIDFIADIKANGLRDPIVVDGDVLLDGRNRRKACEELGIRCPQVQWDGPGSQVGYIVSKNLHRRNLDKTDKAFVALRLKPHFAAEAKERQKGSGGDRKSGSKIGCTSSGTTDKSKGGRALRLAAKAAGVGPTTVGTLDQVIRNAPNLVPLIKAKKLSIDGAWRKSRGVGPKKSGHKPKGDLQEDPNPSRLGKKRRLQSTSASNKVINILHALWAAVDTMEEIQSEITDEDRMKIRVFLSKLRRLTKLKKEKSDVAED